VESLADRYRLSGAFVADTEKNGPISDGLGYEVDGSAAVTFGTVNNELLSHYEIEIPVIFFDLNLEMFTADGDAISFQKLPQFPGIDRDISLAVAADVTAEDIEKIIRKNGGEFLRGVRLYDIYEGDQLDAGTKSMTFSLTFRSDEQTLEDEDVDSQMEKIISETSSVLNAKLR
jgi:phenylalanyl-tRNA synthetase beta chain